MALWNSWTIPLVELIYWDPVARPGTLAERETREMEVDGAKAPQSVVMHMGEMGVDDEDDDPTLRHHNVYIGRRRPGASATLEERRDYSQYLLSGRSLHYPAIVSLL